MVPEKRVFNSFKDFYPFYLSEHSTKNCKRMHFLGTLLGVVCLLIFIVTFNFFMILIGLLLGYACAWIGHYFFEKNKPATFTHPIYSFMGDWVMFKDILVGKIKII